MSTDSDDIDVSVIVLNYNGRHWLEDCLTATLAQMNDREGSRGKGASKKQAAGIAHEQSRRSAVPVEKAG